MIVTVQNTSWNTKHTNNLSSYITKYQRHCFRYNNTGKVKTKISTSYPLDHQTAIIDTRTVFFFKFLMLTNSSKLVYFNVNFLLGSVQQTKPSAC